MSAKNHLLELLELIKTSEAQSRPVKLDEVAVELKCPISRVENLVKIALNEGLIERSDETLKLTDKGRVEVQRHRESYIHERYCHKPGLMGRVSRLFEGSVRDWRGHWRRRHGFDERSLNGFYKSLNDLEGRVEEVSSLTDLRRGDRGVVAFTLGGYGLVRRLAEMGLTPGTEVKVVRSAPFGGPVEVSVRGVSLALGYGVASKVFVKRLKEED
jgi:Fe2+ transport system protein FeoA